MATKQRDESPSGTAELLQQLASMSDADNRDTYLSLYVDMQDPNRARVLHRRVRAIRAAVSDRELSNSIESMYDKGMEMIQNLPGKPRSAAAFLHLNGEIEHAEGLGARIDNAVILDASPYVLPLARFADEYEGFLLVLLDAQRASIHHIEGAVSEARMEHEHTAIGRHKKGGWSQMRYQRNREGVVKGFYDDVSNQLDQLLSELGDLRLIVAGPGSAKTQFQTRMSKRAVGLIVAVEDADMSAGNNKLVERFVQLAKDEEGREETVYIEKLRRGLMTSGLAMMGVKAVLAAAESGRVESLLLHEGKSIPGLKCEPCGEYMFSPGSVCPSCSSAGNQVDLANEAVEAAIRSSSHVEFTDDPFLDELGGIAALLRW